MLQTPNHNKIHCSSSSELACRRRGPARPEGGEESALRRHSFGASATSCT